MGEILWKERKRIWCGLPWTFTVYSFDEEKLYIDSGFLTQRSDEVQLYRVMDISLTSTLLQRIFGLGTVHLDTTDKTSGNFDLKNIKKSKEIKNQLSELIEKRRDSKRVLSREYMGGGSHEDEGEPGRADD